MLKSPIVKIILAFATWRIALFSVAFMATSAIPVFGNRFPYWDNLLVPTGLPSWIWGFGNFDGVHYLRLALYGYEGSQYSQAFFPLYPLLIKLLTFNDLFFITSLFISNLFFLVSIYLFYRLLREDYNQKVSFKSVILLLMFPTSFYFGALYSESLFLFFVLTTFLSLRKKSFLLAGLSACLASATRVMGVFLFPVILIELYLNWKKGENKSVFISLVSLLIAPLSTVFYMLYLKSTFNDPLYFLTVQSSFGAERSQSLVLLPQVLFRYLKIFFTVPVNSLNFFSSTLEFIFTAIPLIILVISYKKIRFSYWIFTLGCLLLPTFTGTLSSMPRYVLMSFLLFPFVVEKVGRYFNILVLLLALLGIILLSLFTRGYWVA